MAYIDTFLIRYNEFIDWTIGYLILAFILILADLYFGLQAAYKRKENVRKYSAIRRTIIKICNYVILIIVAYTVQYVIKFPLPFDINIAYWILIIIFIIEIGSIGNNFFMSIGIKYKFNLLEFILKNTGILEKNKDNDKKEKEEENERD